MNVSTKEKPNSLINEQSPYLLQHAYNPINWHAWNDEAFNKAVAENKPIFLSIGYSTCHWCHVMEKESFANAEVAAILNQHYISIKVDREERPDIDHFYMNVCQSMTGVGGWPLTIIMTPQKQPFFADTYLPKKAKWGHPGLLTLLNEIANKWECEQDNLEELAKKVTEHIQEELQESVAGKISEQNLDHAATWFLKNFHKQYGGFGNPPKFPSPHNLMFLMRQYDKTKEPDLLKMVDTTLTSMYQGGIYDHIGFGFSRYSTDEKWLVPHFEKMLYDNALLAYTYLEAYQVTKNTLYAKVAKEIFSYVFREMTSPLGGFYSAEDADSEGEEGKFYLWSPNEIISILGEELGNVFCETYDVSEQGNFAKKNIPNLIDKEIPYDLEAAKEKLLIYRDTRVRPFKDDKILTSWNGLMVAALAKGAQVLQEPIFAEAADNAIDFIFNNLKHENGLLARFRNQADILGYIDDYAFLIWGLIEQYLATFNPIYIKKALSLTDEIEYKFKDHDNGGYYFTALNQETLFTRFKEIYDGATPSGNSVHALNLLRLSCLTGDIQLLDKAEALLNAFAEAVKKHPAGYSFYFIAQQFFQSKQTQIVIAAANDHQIKKVYQQLNQLFLPNSIILAHTPDTYMELANIAPYVQGTKMINEQTTIYICENHTCHAPITDLEEFIAKVDQVIL